VLVSATKSTITSLLSQRHGWLEIPQNREDYVAYFYRNPYVGSSASSFDSTSTEGEDEAPMVLVEMFVGHQASRFPVSKNCVLRGRHMGTSYIPILSEEYLFRGKLNAAATRGKPGDVSDILYLIDQYGDTIRERLDGIDKTVVNEAVRRHPELRRPLQKVGVRAARAPVRWPISKKNKDKTVFAVVPAKTWDVHRGLGWRD
jgi:predicted nucleotidyltransferase component of viral defense system